MVKIGSIISARKFVVVIVIVVVVVVVIDPRKNFSTLFRALFET